MTKLEEYMLVSDICAQGALWRVDPSDGRTGIELEVLDRLEKLKKELGIALPTTEQPAKRETSQQRFQRDRVRVRFGTHQVWIPKEHVEQQQRTDCIGKWKWVVKDEFKNLYQKYLTLETK